MLALQSVLPNKTQHAKKIFTITACNKARKLRVTSPTVCRRTYLQFAGEFIRGMTADCLRLQVYLPAIAGTFACDCGYFCLRCGYFCLRLLVLLFAHCMYFCLQSRQLCMLVPGKFPWVSHVKLPVKYSLCSAKFTCGCSQFTFTLCRRG